MYSPTQLSEIWQRTLEVLENELSTNSFDTWMRYTQLVDYHDHMMIVLVPNEFAKDWLESRYFNLIKNTLQLLINDEIGLEFVLSVPQQKNSKGLMPNRHSRQTNHVNTANNGIDDTIFSPLNPKYTFNTFIIGNSNRFAHAAALAVAETPAKAYNPLFVYGGVGLGKTHLMQAIGHHVLAHLSHLKVMYVSSEKFTNELINSIRDDKMEEFRTKYRNNIDVLLVDDIQFLAGKERTQEEFFHTFNALHEANRQIIISSDRPPKEIPTLEDRLRSRFEWGLITDMQPPDLETRIAILRKKATFENLTLPDDVMLFIANKVQSNIRELEGALIRVAALNSLTNQRITPDLAADALKDLAGFSKPEPITISGIQETVANVFGLRLEEFKSKRRTKSVAFPRQVAMFLCREFTDASLPRIGHEFGGRDHTTVMHACDKIATQLVRDTVLEKTVKEIINILQTSSSP